MTVRIVGAPHAINADSVRQSCLAVHRIILSDIEAGRNAYATMEACASEGEPIYRIDETPINTYARNCFDSDLSGHLIQIAIKFRIYDDYMKSGPLRDDHISLSANYRQASGILTLRDTCNKIVHATGIRFPLTRDNRAYEPPEDRLPEVMFTDDLMVISGSERNGDPWMYDVSITE